MKKRHEHTISARMMGPEQRPCRAENNQLTISPVGFRHLPLFLSVDQQRHLMTAIRGVIATSPLYQPTMPRTGRPFGVKMTNCGTLGWVSDKRGGYRYQPTHPDTRLPWPPMPAQLVDLWTDVSNYCAPPEACLINFYDAGCRMGSHVDRDELAFDAPVVSISLGCDAIFHLGGLERRDPKQRIRLHSGDVVVMGGASRLCHHGIDRIFPDTSRLLSEGGRINLTLRRVTRSHGNH
jgi:DNA oxidative demethylase